MGWNKSVVTIEKMFSVHFLICSEILDDSQKSMERFRRLSPSFLECKSYICFVILSFLAIKKSKEVRPTYWTPMNYVLYASTSYFEHSDFPSMRYRQEEKLWILPYFSLLELVSLDILVPLPKCESRHSINYRVAWSPYRIFTRSFCYKDYLYQYRAHF